MEAQRINFDPDEALSRAIKLWMRDGDREQPSRSESEVDIEKREVHLRNVKGLLASYRILETGHLRRIKNPRLKGDSDSWIIEHAEELKAELLELAEAGASRPEPGTLLGRALELFTTSEAEPH